MAAHTTPSTLPQPSSENASAPPVALDDAAPSLSVVEAPLPAQAEALLPEALPVEGQMRVLRLLDGETAVAAEPEAETLEELALGYDAIVIEAVPLLQNGELFNPEVLDLANATAEAHSHAAPPPLTETGELIDLLSGMEALSALEGRAPFEWPEDFNGESFVFHAGGGAPGQPFAENAALGGPSSDLIFVDFTPFAKPEGTPGNGGGKGGGNGGDDGDETVDGGGDGGVLSEYLSGDATVDDALEYNILIDFKGSWTAELQDAFIWAADWISDVITDDIPDVFYRGKIIDDMMITAELTNIDGPGGTLGQAGPTAVRTDGYLPAAGKMEFDIADADYFNSIGNWDAIVIHEMLHTIGFGTIWDFLDLVDGSGTATPTFTGTQAVLAYGDLFGGVGDVPLESGYGPGTDESHWDEFEFDNEIMTSFLDSDGDANTVGDNYMSGMTVASLTDIGYVTVNWDSGDWVDPFLSASV